MPTNAYSSRWFAAFLPPGTPPAEAELAFIERHLPRARFPRLLDVCCGIGRHANALAERGYRVLGLDRDLAAIDVARAAAPPGARYLCMDVLALEQLSDPFDAALFLWSSFGHFDSATNESLLAAVGYRLPPGGRILLDIYNREALGGLPARETLTRAGGTIVVTRSLVADRYRVTHEYRDSDTTESFEWVAYSPADLRELGDCCGLRVALACAWFDEGTPPSSEHARMQVLLEKDPS